MRETFLAVDNSSKYLLQLDDELLEIKSRATEFVSEKKHIHQCPNIENRHQLLDRASTVVSAKFFKRIGENKVSALDFISIGVSNTFNS